VNTITNNTNNINSRSSNGQNRQPPAGGRGFVPNRIRRAFNVTSTQGEEGQDFSSNYCVAGMWYNSNHFRITHSFVEGEWETLIEPLH
jgi:hypothetical protein